MIPRVKTQEQIIDRCVEESLLVDAELTGAATSIKRQQHLSSQAHASLEVLDIWDAILQNRAVRNDVAHLFCYASMLTLWDKYIEATK